jgi:hypothetical protein
MRSLSRVVLVLCASLVAWPALAQVVDPELFGDGHLPVYREEEDDRRFMKTGIYGALNTPPQEAACKRVVATLLVTYSEALLYLHRRDQNFYVDPALLNTLDKTASSPDFPARAYLAAMIRRTMIDKHVPAAWIQTSEQLRKELEAPVQVARLQLFAQSVQPIESFSFTMPALLDRYAREVKLAPSVAADAAEDRFRDKYMDRDVTWGGLILSDIAKEAPPPPPKGKKKSRKKTEEPAEPETVHTWAVVGFPVGKAPPTIPGMPVQSAPMVQIRARLKDDQLLDITKYVRGQRVLIKGHLWDIAQNMGWIEVRDADLFPDPDWSTWPGIATAEDVRNCPIAVNDISAYGFRQRPGKGQPDAFNHSKQ